MPLNLHGHFWTLAPLIAHSIRPARLAAEVPLCVTIDDPKVGPVQLRGYFRDHEGATSVLVIVHGHGGNSDSHYMFDAAAAAERIRLPYVRMNLRGADGQGVDFYHAGLFADIDAVIKSDELRRFERVYVLANSIGGNVALRYAASASPDPRVRAVVAVCPPIDLDQVVTVVDGPGLSFYRKHMLDGLKGMYTGIASRRAMQVPVKEAMGISTLRGWDDRIIAPRYGYRSAEHYYAEESAAPRLGQIAIPSLLVVTEADPMVPPHTVRPALRGASSNLQVLWPSAGGHVGFPKSIDLGLGSKERGFEAQVIEWLLQR